MLGSFVVHLVFGVTLMVVSFAILLSIAEAAPTLLHAILASLVVILAAINIILGFIWRAKDSPVMVLPPKRRRVHQILGIVLLLLWYSMTIYGAFLYFTLY
jgi:Ca2+/Na+ antiporter